MHMYTGIAVKYSKGANPSIWDGRAPRQVTVA